MTLRTVACRLLAVAFLAAAAGVFAAKQASSLPVSTSHQAGPRPEVASF
jgi:hypothetical protein